MFEQHFLCGLFSISGRREVGSLGDFRQVKDAIGVAHAVMDYTDHTLIVGESGEWFLH